MTASTDFDVVVVGAGPAGSATAIGCLRAGLRVALLDRVEFPRFQVGESVHPGIEPLLNTLGVAKAAVMASRIRHDGIWVVRHGARTFVPFDPRGDRRWRGFQLDRAQFDQSLCDTARTLGAAVTQKCGVSGVRRVGDDMLIESSQGQFRSRVVVDATGRSRTIASTLGLWTDRCSPRIIAKYGYRGGRLRRLSDRPVFAIRRSGWQWTARVGTDVYQWVTASWVTKDRSSLDMPRELGGLSELGPPRSVDVSWRILRQPATLGFFAVGDAAAVLDPSSSHGVLNALSSGIMAAHCLRARFKGQVSESMAAIAYSRWIRKRFIHDSQQLATHFTTRFRS